jgi:hypothetical protein
MRVLFVCPSTVSSGEAITAQHMARDVVARGGDVWFVASAPAVTFVRAAAADHLTVLTEEDATANHRAWDRAIHRFRPAHVVFADYPLLFFPSGTVPLADDAWVRSLETLDAALVTLDHLGYAQRSQTVFFGPPHLSMAGAITPQLPTRMAVALPSPVHEPGPVAGRIGTPFRAWETPAHADPDDVRKTRERHTASAREILVLHSVPQWASRAAAAWGLPYYRFVPRLLRTWLAGLGRPVTVVSVNDGSLLPRSDDHGVRIVNAAPTQPAEFERLLLAADLVLTENSVSVGLGKAVCALRPAAVVHNSHRLVDLLGTADPPTRRILLDMEAARLGAIFPFAVFPIWSAADLAELGIHRDNRFTSTVAWLEAFGGAETREDVRALILDTAVRSSLCSRQNAFAQAVATLAGPAELLSELQT